MPPRSAFWTLTNTLANVNPDRADTAQDSYVNSIGVAIGSFVAQHDGSFQDVVDLSVQALTGSLSGYSWKDFGPGGALTMNDQGFSITPLDGVSVTLGSGVGFSVSPVGLTNNTTWTLNPQDDVTKIELSNDQSNWFGPDFFHNWVYEVGNGALSYTGENGPKSPNR